MPTHAILITYRDMVSKVSEFIKKAQDKYGRRFEQLYFDSGYQLTLSLDDAVRKIPEDEKLKIFISGHGGTGSQYITADDRVRKQTVGDLAMLLADGLINRATSMGDSANTEVNMVSCLFGRTPDGGLDRCPAVLLHRKLAAKEVYVDLVARTESMAARSIGRKTISLLDLNIDGLKGVKHVTGLARRKTQFTKIRCTYQGDAAVVGLRDYDRGDDVYINSESLEGQRILWADNVINELVKHITPPRGQTEVTDADIKKCTKRSNGMIFGTIPLVSKRAWRIFLIPPRLTLPQRFIKSGCKKAQKQIFDIWIGIEG